MASRPAVGPAAPPLSVKALVSQAENFTFNDNIPLKHWTRAAETLYQEVRTFSAHRQLVLQKSAEKPYSQAAFALADGDYGRAYVMLYRHSVLVLKFLPLHPQFKDPESRKAFKPLSRRIDRVIEDLEQLKPVIEESYREWLRMHPPESREEQKVAAPPPSNVGTYDDFASRDPTLSGNTQLLDASRNQDLAVDLAQQELQRRDTVRRASKRAGISDREALMRRRGGRWDGLEIQELPTSESDLQKQMESARHTIEADKARYAGRNHDADYLPVSQRYHYPSVSKSRPVTFERADSQSSSSSPSQPFRPPKEPSVYTSQLSRSPQDGPQIPSKVPLDSYSTLEPSRPGMAPDPAHGTMLAAAPPRPKKERLTFKPGAYLENGDPIRSVFLPRMLRQSFLEVAEDNTRAGLEMCGILCGTPINNALFIRCLLIPDQKSTSDTCETENESAMFEYCSKEDLMVIGWIHTHPTQTCFMSSRDLHTHAGYQVMMPESIAIVCSPKFTPS